MSKLNVFDIITGAYASEILLQIVDSPIAGDLLAPREPEWLAHRYGLDCRRLQIVLEFLATATTVVERRNACYRLSNTDASLEMLRFHLKKFCGAYGPAVRRSLNGARNPARFVDKKSLADAFKSVDGLVNDVVLEAIHKSRAKSNSRSRTALNRPAAQRGGGSLLRSC